MTAASRIHILSNLSLFLVISGYYVSILQQKLSEDNVVCRRQPNLNSKVLSMSVWKVRLIFLSTDQDKAKAMTIVLQTFMSRPIKNLRSIGESPVKN